MERLARGTTGCTGADLENLVNQAALKGAMDNAPLVTMAHLEYARDKVLMGRSSLYCSSQGPAQTLGSGGRSGQQKCQ